MEHADIAVIGGGIVGLATAYALSKQGSGAKITVIEKEGKVAAHQSGRNSGVIHSGVYYKPGSRKAQNCTRGRQLLIHFCTEHEVPFDICGKVIVATSDAEEDELTRIYTRGCENKVRVEKMTADELRNVEPHVNGSAALLVRDAGIVDFGAVCQKIRERLEQSGHCVLLGDTVKQVKKTGAKFILSGDTRSLDCEYVVNCGGLHCDRIAKLFDAQVPIRIIPFRGEYFALTAEAEGFCKNLIYPVPDPRFPFLGVHFTRKIGGGVECGPNAVFALSREGYDWTKINLFDLGRSLCYPGFLKLGIKHLPYGTKEMLRSLARPLFLKAAQKLLPELKGNHMGARRSGVRAQAVRPNGDLEDDFVVEKGERSVHVLNAPSPGATACFSIGEAVAGMLELQ